MAGKSIEERMADAKALIGELEARKKALARQLKQREHKQRTRRLIQIGGIMVRLGVDTLEKAQRLQQAIEQQPEVQIWLKKVTGVLPIEPQDLET